MGKSRQSEKTDVEPIFAPLRSNDGGPVRWLNIHTISELRWCFNHQDQLYLKMIDGTEMTVESDIAVPFMKLVEPYMILEDT